MEMKASFVTGTLAVCRYWALFHTCGTVSFVICFCAQCGSCFMMSKAREKNLRQVVNCIFNSNLLASQRNEEVSCGVPRN